MVTEQFLDGADVLAIFKEMGGEGMTEGVGGGPLGEAQPTDRLGHGALQHGLVEVMTAALARGAVYVETDGREDPLPRPLAASVGILAGKSPRQLDPAGAPRRVRLVLALQAGGGVTSEAGRAPAAQRCPSGKVCLAVRADSSGAPPRVTTLSTPDLSNY